MQKKPHHSVGRTLDWDARALNSNPNIITYFLLDLGQVTSLNVRSFSIKLE